MFVGFGVYSCLLFMLVGLDMFVCLWWFVCGWGSSFRLSTGALALVVVNSVVHCCAWIVWFCLLLF